MCGRRAVICCCGLPLSVIVLALALILAPPVDKCQDDGRGACISQQPGPAASCGDGFFIELAKQPRLGLRHWDADPRGLVLAVLKRGGVSQHFSLVCEDGKVHVHQLVHGAKSDPTLTALGTFWEVCADGGELQLILPIIDVTHDIEILSNLVDGCIRISAGARFQHLATVRGPLEQQVDALKRRKAAIGGCPTWHSDEDRLARSSDFASLNRLVSFLVRQHMRRTKDIAVKYRLGEIPTAPDALGIFLFAATMVAGGGPSALGMIGPQIFCGAIGPSTLPAINGLQVTRHADVSDLIANPKQRRTHQIGGGQSEVCFEPTLPVFLSTGESAHTQVRKLWDIVGVATMHEADIPEIERPPEADSPFFKIRRAAMAAAGIHAPVLDELALYVAPLFLEMLWGKKPRPEESAFIARYGTFGGACIMSHIVEKLPILPGKIKEIRAATLAFARESPVGKRIAAEIYKPEYAELKALYESRPMGVVDGALGALADASLFAGLIGTSTMTMNALHQIHRGAAYLKMFRENSTAFMIEVMRTATAVGGSIQVTAEPLDLVMAGESVKLPPGSNLMQMTGITGFDSSVFPDPYTFDSNRPNLGETTNFNGLTKHVLARNYTGAPRFCPGAAVAIKIAAKITEYFTSSMA